MSDVPRNSYLTLTPKGYFFRMRVPRRLQAKLGKRELKKAIAGTNRQLAERQAILYAAQAFELFHALEGFPVSQHRQDMVVTVGNATYQLDKEKTAEELDMLIHRGIIRPGAVDQFPVEKPLKFGLPEAPVETRIDGNMPLSTAIKVYIRDLKGRDARFDEEKEKQLLSKLTLLQEIIGDLPIGAVDYYKAEKFRDTYLKLPRYRTTKERVNMTVAELVAENDPVKVSSETVNQRMETISSLFKWLKKRNSSLQDNPFEDMQVKAAEGETTAGNKMKKRLPFTAVELQRLFSDAIWSKHDFDYVWEYWLPLVLLYSGVRVTEFCQLEKKDFRLVEDVWVMSINDIKTKDEPEDVWPKRVKTENSLRDIPIHSHLIDVGFKNFVEEAPSGRLFPDIVPIVGKLAKTPCRRFNEFILPRTGIKSKQVKTLYSMRHTTLNELKQKNVTAEQRAQLAGHAPDQNNMSEAVYGDEFNIKIMQQLVHQLDFTTPMANVKPWPPSKEALAAMAKKARRRNRQAESKRCNKAKAS
ncbi:site-specific integrase [Geomonas sp. Red32]|uniref:site-specific integrase n=1 Tax=Geomonas sp. Red32 TaxID=2912856 RepID=UPI00202CFB2D|nr:site-specific integrase [Geomonas sp. Red32]MCM0083052.1 site-specific integrase [Geomonas sp. Red32]